MEGVSAGKAGTPLVTRDFPWQHLETGARGGLGPPQPGFLLTPSSSSVRAKCSPALTQCLHSHKEALLERAGVPDCQPHTQAVPSCSSLRTPAPSPPGAGDALQRCRERTENTHSSQHAQAERTKTALPGRASRRAGSGFPGGLAAGLWAQPPSRASAQRGRDTPAAPARGYTSRFPGWLLPHSHS